MNGIHDVGGMDGFGSLALDDEKEGEGIDAIDGYTDEYEPFHDHWEGITYSLFVATLGNGIANIDEFRHSIERMDPDRYLQASYYDRWVTGLTRLLLEAGVVDPGDVWLRTAAFAAGDASVPERTEPGLVSDLAAGVADAYGFEQEPQEPRFEEGEEIRVRNHHPSGHTRCPRYARRARGTVTTHRGTFVLPDANAHGTTTAEPLYEVAFSARELWGSDADPNVTVTLDLWESYLTAATAETENGENGDGENEDEGESDADVAEPNAVDAPEATGAIEDGEDRGDIENPETNDSADNDR